MVSTGDPLDPWFEECLTETFRFRSTCGTKELVVGVPKHCANWRMPEKTHADMMRVRHMWKEISDGTLLDTVKKLVNTY